MQDKSSRITIPYLEPPYPAAVLQCQLCGTPVGEAPYFTATLTDSARYLGSSERREVLVCHICQPRAQQLVDDLKALEERLDADYEAVKREEKRGLIQRMLGMSPSEPPAQKKRGRPPKSRTAEIPVPSHAD